VLAGRAAGATTVAAAWGYLDGGDPHAWGADHVVDAPAGLPRAIGLA
jgi:phosphoglycolate phosphatase